MTNAGAVLVDADGGEDLWFGGGLVTFKVTSEQSGGAYVVLHDRMPRGKATPLHVHPGFTETVYVLEGELLFHINGAEHAAAVGATGAIPPGVPHALLVTSEEARLLAFVTPGDVFERFFREGGDVPTSRDATPPPLDIEKVRAAGERTGAMQVLGPPPFAVVGTQH